MRTTLLVVVALCWLSACDSDNGNWNTTPADTGANNGDVLAQDGLGIDLPAGACAELPDLTGRAYRVTQLKAQKPTDKVNDVWAADIADYELVLVFHVVSHDVATGAMELQVTSAQAEKTDDGQGNITPTKYNYMLEPSTFDAQLDDCKITWTTPIELNIVTSTINKPFHVFGITGYVNLSPDGSEIPGSFLSGAISEEETFDLCMTIPELGVANFHWFMNLAHICPDFDSDGDGTIDAYKFTGLLTGVDETELFDTVVIPMEGTGVTCDENTVECK